MEDDQSSVVQKLEDEIREGSVEVVDLKVEVIEELPKEDVLQKCFLQPVRHVTRAAKYRFDQVVINLCTAVTVLERSYMMTEETLLEMIEMVIRKLHEVNGHRVMKNDRHNNQIVN